MITGNDNNGSNSNNIGGSSNTDYQMTHTDHNLASCMPPWFPNTQVTWILSMQGEERGLGREGELEK